MTMVLVLLLVHLENVKNIQIENSKWILEYDTGWIKDNTDYPTLLNNFIYLFEYIDSQARFPCVSSHGERHPLTILKLEVLECTKECSI